MASLSAIAPASRDRPYSAPFPTIEISAAGYALLACALSELLFNRVLTALGVYNHAGMGGVFGYMSMLGRFSMNATGIMSLVLACVLLPRLSSNSRFSALPARVLLMLTSPLYLPVVCVAVFRPVSSALVLASYLVAVLTMVFLSALVALGRIDGGRRRIIMALAIVQLLSAFELMTSARLPDISHRLYVFAEALFIATPVFGFFVFLPRGIRNFARRPHLPGLLFGMSVASLAGFIAYLAVSKTPLTLVLLTFRSLGVTLSVPGGLPVYLIALFFGASLVGGLVLPSRTCPPTPDSRRAGIGLACIWAAGLQPTDPYQMILAFVGFLYLACSMAPQKA